MILTFVSRLLQQMKQCIKASSSSWEPREARLVPMFLSKNSTTLIIPLDLNLYDQSYIKYGEMQ